MTGEDDVKYPLKLVELAKVIRSKNAGPYELTFDIIFPDKSGYDLVKKSGVINEQLIARLYKIPLSHVLRLVFFDPANAIKATIRRQIPCGGIGETDVYGAQQHGPLLGICIDGREGESERKTRIADSAVTIVLGVIGADVHAIGNKILELALAEAGFKVVNLGVLTSQEEFIGAATETDARAILVSSLYGHAELDCEGFRGKCIEAGIGDILLYIGGNLVVGKSDWSEVERRFKALGFDRVYQPDTRPQAAIDDLRKDLNL